MAPNRNGAACAVPMTEMAAPAVGRLTDSSLKYLAATSDMTSEVDRLATLQKWPVSFINKSAMASAGFYYINKADIVRCAFCAVEVGHWEEGDVPMEEHRRWSPSCQLVRSKAAGNPKTANSSSIRKPVNDVCGVYGVEIRPNSGPENGMKCEKHLLEQTGINKYRVPSHKAYASMNARIKSFDSWPMFLKPRPEELVEAGFFYTGKGDQTLCFVCGVGLNNWQPTDDPWVEHCKWSPKCSYVVLSKGRDFIENVLAEKEPIVPSEAFQNLTVNERKGDEKIETLCSASLQESRDLQEPSSDSTLCKICYKEELGVVFLPCSHLVACVKCALVVQNCPICRKPVTATVRAYLS